MCWPRGNSTERAPMSKKPVKELAAELRDLSDEFDNEAGPVAVIRSVLNERIAAVKEEDKAVEEKQTELQEKFIGHAPEEEDPAPEGASTVERKQAELREKFRR